MAAILELHQISKRFPGLVANDSVSFTVQKGEIHAVVGENGAGKSTLMNVITGLYQADAGEIHFKDRKLRLSGPRDAIHQGIGMVHQHFMLINRFNVIQNIILGQEPGRAGIIDFHQAVERVAELCRVYDFRLDLDNPVGELSVGHQQRVEILKILYRGADLLILDEPTSVLTPQEVKELFANLRRLKKQGKTVLFISHKLDEVLQISDRITVLRRGQVVGTVTAAQTNKGRLAEMMVGKPVLFALDKPPVAIKEAVLQVANLQVNAGAQKQRLTDVSFAVRRGEIYGLAGVEGNGQKELVEAIIGLIPFDSGEITIMGRPIKGLGVRATRDIGAAYIPEDRHRRGLVLPLTVWENTALGAQRKSQFGTWWALRTAAMKSFAREKAAEYDIRLGSLDLPIKNLSGGNQQKVILARELSGDPDLLIAAQPVRGLDIGAIKFVHHQLLAARQDGKAILLVSADLEEILSLSDRVGIIYNGRLVKEFVPGELALEDIGGYMLGAGERVG